MTPWAIRQQTLYVKGDVCLTFHKRGGATFLDVQIAGVTYRVGFDGAGDVKAVRPVTVDKPAMTG